MQLTVVRICLFIAFSFTLISCVPDTQSQKLSKTKRAQTAVTNPKAIISGLTPSAGTVLGNESIAVTGTNFVAGLKIWLGSSECASVTVSSSTSAICITNPHPAGVVNVLSLNEGATGQQTLTNAFTFSLDNPPTASLVMPATALTAGGSLHAITGAEFQDGGTCSPTYNCGVSEGETCLDHVSVGLGNSPNGILQGKIYGSIYHDSQNDTCYVNTDGATAWSSFSPAGTRATMGPTSCVGVEYVSSTSINCFAPVLSYAGVYTLRVTNPDSQFDEMTAAYTVTYAAPTVSAVDKAFGSTLGSEYITVTGSNFLNGAEVSINSVNCLTTTVSSSTSLICQTPSMGASGGPYNVVVTNPDAQTATLAVSYTYYAPPTITSINTENLPLDGSVTITVTGTNFLSTTVSGGTPSISINGVACDTTTYLTANTMSCDTPAFVISGSYDVTLTNPDNQYVTLTSGVTYFDNATITGVSPANGPSGTVFNMTITGTNFSADSLAFVNSVACTTTTYLSSTSLQCVVPATVAGIYNVDVNNVPNQNVISVNALTLRDAPTYTSIDGNNAAGAILYENSPTSGGLLVTINGGGFYSGVTVKLGASNCVNVTLVSAAQITCTTTSHSEGDVFVTITNADGQNVSSAAVDFSYVSSPIATSITSDDQISELSVVHGPDVGGSLITVIGSKFVSGAVISFNGTACATTFNSSTSVECTTAAMADGYYNVKVTNPDGQFSTLNSALLILGDPVVTSVTPGIISIAGNVELVVKGLDFIDGFDSVDADGTDFRIVLCSTYTSIAACQADVDYECSSDPASATELLSFSGANQASCHLPAALTAGQYGVMVENADDSNNVFMLPGAVEVVADPTIIDVDLGSTDTDGASNFTAVGKLTGSTTVHIEGTNLLAQTQVKFDGNLCTSQTVNAAGTEIICVTPAGTTEGHVDVTVEHFGSTVAAQNLGAPGTTPARLENGYYYISAGTLNSVGIYKNSALTGTEVVTANFITGFISDDDTNAAEATFSAAGTTHGNLQFVVDKLDTVIDHDLDGVDSMSLFDWHDGTGTPYAFTVQVNSVDCIYPDDMTTTNTYHCSGFAPTGTPLTITAGLTVDVSVKIADNASSTLTMTSHDPPTVTHVSEPSSATLPATFKANGSDLSYIQVTGTGFVSGDTRVFLRSSEVPDAAIDVECGNVTVASATSLTCLPTGSGSVPIINDTDYLSDGSGRDVFVEVTTAAGPTRTIPAADPIVGGCDSIATGTTSDVTCYCLLNDEGTCGHTAAATDFLFVRIEPSDPPTVDSVDITKLQNWKTTTILITGTNFAPGGIFTFSDDLTGTITFQCDSATFISATKYECVFPIQASSGVEFDIDYINLDGLSAITLDKAVQVGCNYGAWTTVDDWNNTGSADSVSYGPSAFAEDPTTGYLYAAGNFENSSTSSAAWIRYSTDNGLTWADFSASGISAPVIRGLTISATGDLYIGGDGGGEGWVYKYNGTSWDELLHLTNPSASYRISDILYDDETSTLYALGLGNTVLEAVVIYSSISGATMTLEQSLRAGDSYYDHDSGRLHKGAITGNLYASVAHHKLEMEVWSKTSSSSSWASSTGLFPYYTNVDYTDLYWGRTGYGFDCSSMYGAAVGTYFCDLDAAYYSFWDRHDSSTPVRSPYYSELRAKDVIEVASSNILVGGMQTCKQAFFKVKNSGGSTLVSIPMGEDSFAISDTWSDVHTCHTVSAGDATNRAIVVRGEPTTDFNTSTLSHVSSSAWDPVMTTNKGDWREVMSLGIDQNGRVLAGLGPYAADGEGAIQVSADNGENWTVDGLAPPNGTYIYDIFTDSEGHLYYGAHRGLSAGSKSWQVGRQACGI